MRAEASGEVGADRAYGNRWLILLATSMALFMVVLDSTVVNVSIPSIIRDLHATLPEVEWVLNAYTLTFASLLITFGRMGDMYGRRRLFVLGMTIFGAGSLACALAPTPAVLIAFRVVQASGSAFMLPATLSLTAVNFPASERGRALGVWGSVSGVALGVGPTLGGFLTQFDWRFVFLINLPIVLLTIWFTMRVVPPSREQGEHRIDWAGVALSIGSLVAFNYAIIQAPSAGWTDPVIVALFVLAAVLLALFLWWETRAREPLTDLRLFRDRTFAAGNTSAALLLFSMFGVFFLMPLFLQNELGFGALATGLALTPLSAAMMVVAPISGRLSDRIGPRWLAFAGLATAAAAIMWMSFLSPHTTVLELAPKFVLAGLGMGLVLAPVTSAVMGGAPPGEEGGVSGVLATTRQVGGVMGVAILGAVLQAQATATLAGTATPVPGLQPAVAERVATAVVLSQGGFAAGTGAFSVTAVGSQLPFAALEPIVDASVSQAVRALPAAVRVRLGAPTLATYGRAAALRAAGAEDSGRPPTASPDPALAGYEASVATGVRGRLRTLSRALSDAVEAAFIVALGTTFRVAALLTAVGALVALLMRRPNPPPAAVVGR